eukprot:TRINITY_DN7501_c0_g2_i1.p1 TRINITY_DN7501_c0_g2~~TRINITY_DN7501_c0_g2_i1.p1  ORF type:complete len:205 (-),score=-13.27 TRINITY_DN7501_c0_g2_i1:2-616(-)
MLCFYISQPILPQPHHYTLKRFQAIENSSLILTQLYKTNTTKIYFLRTNVTTHNQNLLPTNLPRIKSKTAHQNPKPLISSDHEIRNHHHSKHPKCIYLQQYYQQSLYILLPPTNFKNPSAYLLKKKKSPQKNLYYQVLTIPFTFVSLVSFILILVSFKESPTCAFYYNVSTTPFVRVSLYSFSTRSEQSKVSSIYVSGALSIES